MCDPVTAIAGALGVSTTTAAVGVGVVGGLVASKALSHNSSAASAASNPDPATERAKVEADAAQKANAQLAADNRRRREQGSLLAKGAPQPTLGDSMPGTSVGGGLSPIGTSTPSFVTRNTTARAPSLMSLGMPGQQPTGLKSPFRMGSSPLAY